MPNDSKRENAAEPADDAQCGSLYRGRGGLERCELDAGHEDGHVGRRTVWTDEDQINTVVVPAEPPVIDRETLRELVQAWKVGPHRPDSTKVERDDYRRRFADAVMELARPESEVKAEALRWVLEQDLDLSDFDRSWLRERAESLVAINRRGVEWAGGRDD